MLASIKPDLQRQATPPAGQWLQLSNLDSESLPSWVRSGETPLGQVVLKIRRETTYVQRRVQHLAPGWHLFLGIIESKHKIHLFLAAFSAVCSERDDSLRTPGREEPTQALGSGPLWLEQKF